MTKRKPLSGQTTQTCTITALSHEGRGIAHVNGKTIFLDNGLIGEEVEFHYTKKRKQHAEGQVTAVLKAASERITPKCPHSAICGGCSLQHMQHTTQLELKQKTLLEQLQHFAQTEPETVLEPLTAPIWGYRNKARLGAKYVVKKERLLVGFREKNGRYLADLNQCHVLHPSVGTRLSELSELIRELSCYREIPQIEVAIGDQDVALIFRHLTELTDDDLAKLTAFGKKNSFYIFLQPNKIDSIHLLYPKNSAPYLTYQLPAQNIEFLFHPTDFTQVNNTINRKMVTRAIELLQPQPDETLLDLFCGIGNFTLPLAKQCKKIIGVEGNQNAIERANSNAKHNNITNIDFYTADLTDDVNNQPWTQLSYDKIVLDPPRTGAAEIIDNIARFNASKILYISCNPATLARDTGALIKQGYRLTAAGIMDMFPHTKHVESIALFEK